MNQDQVKFQECVKSTIEMFQNRDREKAERLDRAIAAVAASTAKRNSEFGEIQSGMWKLMRETTK